MSTQFAKCVLWFSLQLYASPAPPLILKAIKNSSEQQRAGRLAAGYSKGASNPLAKSSPIWGRSGVQIPPGPLLTLHFSSLIQLIHTEKGRFIRRAFETNSIAPP
jgi:hypothetical protein